MRRGRGRRRIKSVTSPLCVNFMYLKTDKFVPVLN
jgi:hypothetical protein